MHLNAISPVISHLLLSSEFWSAIAGALIGCLGAIAWDRHKLNQERRDSLQATLVAMYTELQTLWNRYYQSPGTSIERIEQTHTVRYDLRIMPSVPTASNLPPGDNNVYVLHQPTAGETPIALYYVNRQKKTPSTITPLSVNLSNFLTTLFPQVVLGHDYQDIPNLPFFQLEQITAITGHPHIFNQYYLVSEKYFTIYDGNAHFLGRLSDKELIKDLISTYIAAKGFIDSFRLNNLTLLRYKELLLMDARQTPNVGAMLQHNYNSLIYIANALRLQHDQLKNSIPILKAKLDKAIDSKII